MHPAAGMRRGRGEVDPAHRRTGTGQTRGRAEDQLLVQLRRAAADGAVEKVLVVRLQPVRRHHVPPAHPAAKARSELLDLVLDPVGDDLGLTLVPAAGQAVGAGVAEHVLRDVGVRPDGLGAGG